MIGWILGILMWIVDAKHIQENHEMDVEKEKREKSLIMPPIIGKKF
jgi:hypothetical protein